MLLLDLFEMFEPGSDAIYKWHKKLGGGGPQTQYIIEVDGKEMYSVVFTQFKFNARMKAGLKSQLTKPQMRKIQDRVVHDLQFARKVDGQYTAKKTGTGDEVRVFATVIDIVRDFVKNHHVIALTFAAADKEPSRVKLYNRMAKNASRVFPSEKFKFKDGKGGDAAERYMLINFGAK